jgi:putative oxidoreductase
MNTANFLERWSPRLLSVLRIVAAMMFLLHGSMKLFNFPPSEMTRDIQILSLAGVGGLLEFFGGVLLLFGLFTRPVAFILSGEMAVAYFKAHFPQGFWPVMNRGELAVLYCFLFLYLVAAGGGVWSFDKLLRKKQQ